MWTSLIDMLVEQMESRKLMYQLAAMVCLGLAVTGEIPYTYYEYEIDTKPRAVKEGYVPAESVHGSMVRLHSIETNIRNGEDIDFIRLTVTKGDIISVNTSFLVIGTDAFMVDDDNFLVVNNTEDVEASTEFIFNIILVRENDHRILSNPLPLAVHRDKRVEDKTEEEYSKGAAIFAGVLVLLIVFMALFIPLVIRAKRRIKQGKHPFKLGSHPSMTNLKDADEAGMPRIESLEPNWYQNTVFNYGDEVKKEKSEFTHDIKVIDDTLQLNKKPKDDTKPDQAKINTSVGNVKGILKNGLQQNKNTETVKTEESRL